MIFDISSLGMSIVKPLAYEVIQEYAKGNIPAYQRQNRDDEISVQIDACASRKIDQYITA